MRRGGVWTGPSRWTGNTLTRGWRTPSNTPSWSSEDGSENRELDFGLDLMNLGREFSLNNATFDFFAQDRQRTNKRARELAAEKKTVTVMAKSRLNLCTCTRQYSYWGQVRRWICFQKMGFEWLSRYHCRTQRKGRRDATKGRKKCNFCLFLLLQQPCKQL